jgi:hypothetical protein
MTFTILYLHQQKTLNIFVTIGWEGLNIYLCITLFCKIRGKIFVYLIQEILPSM